MSSLYTETIQHAYRHPEHRGELEHATHTAEEENPLCGDILRVQLRVEGGHIVDAKFQGRGCVISQGSAELMLERILNEPISAIDELNKDVVLEEIGLPSISPARLKCALLSTAVIRSALRRGESSSLEPA